MQMGSSKGEQTINNFIELNRIEIISESNRIVFCSAESPSTNCVGGGVKHCSCLVLVYINWYLLVYICNISVFFALMVANMIGFAFLLLLLSINVILCVA